MGRIQEALNKAEISRDQRRRTERQLVRLLHQSGSMAGREQRFNNSSLLIGRGPHNDVAYDPFEDGTVSSQHAEIRYEGDEFVVYDMGSLNGTLVNGFPVRRAIIVPGDQITLGRQGPAFTFEVEQAPAAHPVAGPSDNPETPHSWSQVTAPSIPETDKNPIFEEVPAPQTASHQTLLVVILLGILLDVAISLVRMF